MEEISSVIQDTLAVESIYICLADQAGESFETAHRSRPISGVNVTIRKDNPMVEWMRQNRRGCIQISEFRRTVLFKSMWEEEKRLIRELGIQCICRRDEENLAGIVPGHEKEGEVLWI